MGLGAFKTRCLATFLKNPLGPREKHWLPPDRKLQCLSAGVKVFQGGQGLGGFYLEINLEMNRMRPWSSKSLVLKSPKPPLAHMQVLRLGLPDFDPAVPSPLPPRPAKRRRSNSGYSYSYKRSRDIKNAQRGAVPPFGQKLCCPLRWARPGVKDVESSLPFVHFQVCVGHQ